MGNEDRKTPLSKAFDTDDIFASKELITIDESSPTIEPESSADQDYREARDNIKDVLKKANDVLDDLAGFTEAAQTARAYEVYSTMVKTIIDGNKDLLELAKKKKDLDGGNGEDESPKTVNNTLVVGTTEELQDFLESQGIVSTVRQIPKKEKEE